MTPRATASTSVNQPHAGTGATNPRAALERELTRLLRRARTASAALAGDVHPELDVAGYTVLSYVLDLAESMPHGVRAADLAEAVGLHKSTVSRNITHLETLGLLERVPAPTDARALLLQLTPTGKSALTDARAARRKRLAKQMSGWAQSDVDQLAALLRRLNNDLS